MEKRSITGKDILRMDGLLPPTRRLPVCDAVSSSDKKKDKKWSIGGILKRISSMRDYDSSSNDEEMVYCTRQPRTRTVFDKKSRNVILHPVKKTLDQRLTKNNSVNDETLRPTDTPNMQKDCANSRSSDGSLEGASKRSRKHKLKARVEAQRDLMCAESSSDEESKKSCNSLTRSQNENAMQTAHKNGSCNRKSRAARTERYLKRLFKEETNKQPENLNHRTNKGCSLNIMDDNQSSASMNANEYRPPLQPQRFTAQSNSYTFPGHRSAENLYMKSSMNIVKRPVNQYTTDLNQNSAHSKANILIKNKEYINHNEHNYIINSAGSSNNCTEPCNSARNSQFFNRNSPPEPPPRDPRRVFTYGCHSFPFNGKYQGTRYNNSTFTKADHVHESSREHSNGLRSYESNNEINWYGSTKPSPCRPLSLTVPPTQSCSLSRCTNNRHNSTGRHVNVTATKETETMKCQRRNDRNDQLNLSYTEHDRAIRGKKLPATFIQNIHNNSPSGSSENPRAVSPFKRTTPERLHNSTSGAFRANKSPEKITKIQSPPNEQNALERRRSSKNLEEALSELEAIYNSLRLGDEDLLDRAERRSMEEFSLRQGKTNDTVAVTSPDSPDRMKDDMAYRRMHPKERPSSLSEVVGQSALSNISYLMASPILTRKDSVDDYPYVFNYPARKDEPDVTRDDMVYRSIHHANNTLKVVDPQPPFGIPLGPVSTATESDYLHTTPTKSDQPRSLYIPQCEPDIVTDDLAYRTLRKDANTAKNTVENKSSVARDQETTFGMKKKRAIRSLSANLYGLINHDRIHLRREPSLQELNDEMSNTLIDINSLPSRNECVRRVVSDGELSDYDTRWRTEHSLKNNKTDINGNHAVSNMHRKKLRVYMSPSTTVQHLDKNEEDKEAQNSVPPNATLSKALNNEFWHDCLQAKSNDTSNKDTESDFTAYSRLCQDLVNLIEGPNSTDEQSMLEVSKGNTEQSLNTSNQNDDDKIDEFSVLHIQTLGSQYSENKPTNGDMKIEKKEEIESLTKSSTNTENKNGKKTEDKTFDFYLRVADENVKLIAEAFSSVADHLRDSRLSQKNSLTLHRSEIETDSTPPNTSTRSSATFSLEDTNDNLSNSSKTTDILDTVPKEDSLEKDNDKIELEEYNVNSSIDPELDLSKAVHDLQAAAASLCDHEKEIEELEALLKKDTNDDTSNVPNNTNIEKESLLLTSEKNILSTSEGIDEHSQEETIISSDIELQADECTPDSEGESTEFNNICELYDVNFAESTGMRVSYVTNLITVTITAYSVILLACFLALLLATVAAS